MRATPLARSATAPQLPRRCAAGSAHGADSDGKILLEHGRRNRFYVLCLPRPRFTKARSTELPFTIVALHRDPLLWKIPTKALSLSLSLSLGLCTQTSVCIMWVLAVVHACTKRISQLREGKDFVQPCMQRAQSKLAACHTHACSSTVRVRVSYRATFHVLLSSSTFPRPPLRFTSCIHSRD